MAKVLTQKQRNILLILVCTLVYTCTYLLKLSYNANIVCIEKEFSVSHADAGLVSTLFFISYGIGQIVNGILVRKYPLKYTVTGSILISCIFNILLVTSPSFIPMKYYWLINGFALSTLWPSMIRMIGEHVDKEYKNKAILFVGLTTAAGTIIVYGLSAAFVALNCYKVIFYVGVGLGVCFSLLWFFSYNRIKKDVINEAEVKESKYEKKKRNKVHVFAFIAIIAIMSVTVALARDGLTIWFPLVLKEKYGYQDSISVLLTMLLPIVSLFGTSLAIQANKKIKNYILLSSIFFAGATILMGINSGIDLDIPVYMIIAFALSSLLLSGIVNITTSMIPIRWEDPKKSGFYAGLFNGFCYAGSAISSFGLGAIADNYGWDKTMLFLVIILACSAALGFIYIIIRLITRYK